MTTSVETLQEFLSTPSARRATDKMELDSKGNVFLSTPSARRATLARFSEMSGKQLFLSTPSARRATCSVSSAVGTLGISIHALREEGDLTEVTSC